MFYNSFDLDKLARKKCELGCRDALKNVCTRYIKCGDVTTVINAYRIADSLGHLNPNLNIVAVVIHQGVMFFHDKPENVRNIVEEIQPIRKGRVADSVLVKMIYSRLEQLDSVIKNVNEYLKKSYEWQLKLYEDNKTEIPEYPSLIPFPAALITIKSVMDFLATHESRYEIKSMKTEFEKVFLKPEIRDIHVQEANDLLVASRVINQ